MTPAEARRWLAAFRSDPLRCPDCDDMLALHDVGATIERLARDLGAARASLQWTATHARRAQQRGPVACEALVEQLATSDELARLLGVA